MLILDGKLSLVIIMIKNSKKNNKVNKNKHLNKNWMIKNNKKKKKLTMNKLN